MKLEIDISVLIRELEYKCNLCHGKGYTKTESKCPSCKGLGTHLTIEGQELFRFLKRHWEAK